MNASAAIAHSLLRQACMRLPRHAGGRARRSVSRRTLSSTPRSLSAPRARLATRLRDFATNRHEQSGLHSPDRRWSQLVREVHQHARAATNKECPGPTGYDPLKSSLDIPEPTRIGMLLLRPYSRFWTRSRGQPSRPGGEWSWSEGATLGKGGPTMKQGSIGLTSVVLGMMILAPPAMAGTLVEFEGGIGVIPAQRVTGNAATGTADRNDFRGVQPGSATGQIRRFDAMVSDIDT